MISPLNNHFALPVVDIQIYFPVYYLQPSSHPGKYFGTKNALKLQAALSTKQQELI
jgi:hypothetical protein